MCERYHCRATEATFLSAEQLNYLRRLWLTAQSTATRKVIVASPRPNYIHLFIRRPNYACKPCSPPEQWQRKKKNRKCRKGDRKYASCATSYQHMLFPVDKIHIKMANEFTIIYSFSVLSSFALRSFFSIFDSSLSIVTRFLFLAHSFAFATVCAME